MRPRFFLELSLVACAACHGGAPAVDAVVVERAPPSEKRAGAVLKTMPGVRASLTCPDMKTQLPDLTTDENGHAHFYMERRWHRACVLTVSKDGYETQKITIGDVCGKHEVDPKAEYCALATIIVVELAPVAR